MGKILTPQEIDEMLEEMKQGKPFLLEVQNEEHAHQMAQQAALQIGKSIYCYPWSEDQVCLNALSLWDILVTEERKPNELKVTIQISPERLFLSFDPELAHLHFITTVHQFNDLQAALSIGLS